MQKPNRLEIFIQKIYKNNPKHIVEFGIVSMFGMITTFTCSFLCPEHISSLVSTAVWLVATFLFIFVVPPVRMVENPNHKKLVHVSNIYFVIVLLVCTNILST